MVVTWSQLLLPTLVSGVLVFIASSLIHMVILWHKSDYRGVPNEDELRAVLNKNRVSPGQYLFPYCASPKDMASPELQRKYTEGPIGVMYVRPSGPPSLGPFLAKWFLYSLVVSLTSGYVAHVTILAGAQYGTIFRVVGVTAWLAYCWQGPADSIWMGKPWGSTFKYCLDGLIYAALTAGAYAWLWPR
jgi:hypothetical protein